VRYATRTSSNPTSSRIHRIIELYSAMTETGFRYAFHLLLLITAISVALVAMIRGIVVRMLRGTIHGTELRGVSVAVLSGCLSYSIEANAASATSSGSVRAAAQTLDGTQSGNGTSLVTWLPELVWTSRTCERRTVGSRPAARTRAGHNRRWTNVILPLISRHTRTSSLSRTARVTAKISLLFG
jgi:hypothetical protein